MVLDYPGGPHRITRVLPCKGVGQQTRGAGRRCADRCERLGDGQRFQELRDVGTLQKLEEEKGLDFLLETLERTGPVDVLIFGQWV